MSSRVRHALARMFPGILLVVIGLLAALVRRGRPTHRSAAAVPLTTGKPTPVSRPRGLGVAFYGLAFLALVLGLGLTLFLSSGGGAVRRFLAEPAEETGQRSLAVLSPGKEGADRAAGAADRTETQRGPASADPGASPLPAPTFETVRVARNGNLVVAGRAAPNDTVALLVDGKPVAEAVADASGQFAVVPPTLPTGTSEVGLRVTDAQGRVRTGSESVAVAVSPSRDTLPLVALTAPDRATRVLSQADPVPKRPDEKSNDPVRGVAGSDVTGTGDPAGGENPRASGLARAFPNSKIISEETYPEGSTLGSTKSAAPDATGSTVPGTGVPAATGATLPKIVSVDAGPGGRLFVSGQAAAGATIRLYLNDTLIAPARVGRDGAVHFTIGGGVRPGAYAVRLDQVDGTPGTVRSRVEVPFLVPTSEPSAEPEPSPAVSAGLTPGATTRAPMRSEPPRDPSVPVTDPSAVFVPEVKTTRIERGDSLWAISRRVYGEGDRYTAIYDANQDQIREPDLIYPGQVFVLPGEVPPETGPDDGRG